MKALILCEGKTDAILISYLLCKVSGWHFSKGNKKMNISVNERKNQSANWYIRDNDELLICGVGGKNNFSEFFADKIYDLLCLYQKGDTFDKIVVIEDKDTDETDTVENSIKNSLQPIAQQVKNNEWKTNEYEDSFKKTAKIDLLALIIPFEYEGALERVMLNSLKEDINKKAIVECSETFVEEIKEIAKTYIKNPRLELKSKLGVAFAVLSQMKVFSVIDELIKSVDWEKYDNIKKVFGKILEL